LSFTVKLVRSFRCSCSPLLSSSGFLDPVKTSAARRALAGVALTLLLLGELLALAVLSVGHDFPFAFALAAQAVSLGFASVVALALVVHPSVKAS
jgi:hypothetical protein